MRTIKFTVLLLGLFSFLFTSCVKDDDFELPNIDTTPTTFDGTVVTLADVVKTSSDKVQTYMENNAIEGHVISSDQGGNYYKKIYIQTLDGTDGFSVAINKAGLYAEYPVGTKVQLRLKDMSVQLVNGKLEVGYGEHADKYGNIFVGQMPDGVYRKALINTGEKAEIATLAHEITSLKDLDKKEFVNRLITVKNVAFELAAVGKKFHEKENDARYGTDYTLYGKNGGKLTFRTSKFSKFKDNTVPKEIVNITAVLTQYKKYYQFMVNRYEDIEIQEGTNGADIINNAGGGDNPDYTPKVVDKLDETFNGVKAEKDINLEGWFVGKEKGERNWIGKERNGEFYTQISGYKAKSKEIVAWLVTPGLDLSKAKNKNFTFDSNRGYSKGETLEVLISSDFKGDTKKATWKKLDGVKLADANKNGYGKKFVNAGNVDLSAYNGVVYVAFKYVGDNSDKSGTFQIDNVKFNYEGGTDEPDEPYEPKVVTELNETFDGVQSDKDINLEGWALAKEGERNWIGKERNGEFYTQISGYKAKSEEIVAWLVTPGLDLNGATNKNFTFDSNRGYSKDETLEVLISSDFKGDVTKATWQKLDGVKLADANKNGYGKKFVNSGNVDLSAYNGVVYVAFKYVGNNSDKSGTFQIDNVKFNYEGGTDEPDEPYEPKVVTELNETFDGVQSDKDINLEGWSLAKEGDRNWIGKERNSEFYTQISGYKAKSTEVVAWLVTPGLDLSKATNKNFTFDSNRGFSKGETLEVLISSDFKGDAKKATWTKLDGVKLADANKSGYGKKFVNAGDVDLSAYNGIVFVAFKYVGNNSDKSGTFQIDNVKFNYTPNNNTDKALELDKENVTLKAGETATVAITSGNGAYTVASSDDAIATATEASGTITITAKAEGTAEITVTDTKTNESKKIAVTVEKADNTDKALELDKESVTLKVGKTATVAITSGNGAYTVASSDDAIATATEASGTITITAKAEGNAEITVTDTKTNESKKITVTVEKADNPETGNLLFPGSDFEDWDLFKSSLNKYGVKKYATQSAEGQNGSKALHIKGKPSKNDYVFTAKVPDGFNPAGKKTITFYIKGTTSGKSISLNLYKEGGKNYYRFNLGDCTEDKVLDKTSSNQYTGTIDTAGKWVKITLNIEGLEDIAKSGEKLFALKVGKKSDWDILVDNITIE